MEFGHEAADVAEHGVFSFEVFWIQGAHFWEDGLEVGADIGGFSFFEGRGEVAQGGFAVEVVSGDDFLSGIALFELCELEKAFEERLRIGEAGEVGGADEVDDECFFGAVLDTGPESSAYFFEELCGRESVGVVFEDPGEDEVKVDFLGFEEFDFKGDVVPVDGGVIDVIVCALDGEAFVDVSV